MDFLSQLLSAPQQVVVQEAAQETPVTIRTPIEAEIVDALLTTQPGFASSSPNSAGGDPTEVASSPDPLLEPGVFKGIGPPQNQLAAGVDPGMVGLFLALIQGKRNTDTLSDSGGYRNARTTPFDSQANRGVR